MLWLRAFHIVFMVTWFAGLFYLPRLFIYHLQAREQAEHERFCVMERKLFAIMTVGAALTVVFGAWLLVRTPGLLGVGWMQLKLALVAGLAGYHLWCGLLVRQFKAGATLRGDLWLRWFNEVPALLLIGIVVLAVVKPF